ncbi:MAG: response regulator transcription factor [Burkholderiaceae bacterium]|jgi:DNA-binding response OmpR family regulator
MKAYSMIPTRTHDDALLGVQGLFGARACAVTPAFLKALVADPDPEARAPLCTYLTEAGFDVHEASTGRELCALLDQVVPDLVVLDLNLPDEHGLKTCWRVRGLSDAAIVMVTNPDNRQAGVLGLETGADDYLVKPYTARELLARTRAILRRRKVSKAALGPPERAACYRFGPFTLSTARRELVSHATQEPISITGSEYRILSVLLGARGKVISKAELARVPGLDRVVMSHNLASTVYHLRQKLKELGPAAGIIGTVRSVGYVIKGHVEVSHE